MPLAFAPDVLARYGDLSGVSIDVEVALRRGPVPREPAVHAPRPVRPRDPADLVVLADGARADRDRPAAGRRRRAVAGARARDRGARLDSVLAERLPKRFAQQWCAAHGLAAADACSSPTSASSRSARNCIGWEVLPSGTLGYNKAEVTLGGVDTRDLSSKTMEAAAVPGLYFIGEVVDVTGWLGGYNFQWAWASGTRRGRLPDALKTNANVRQRKASAA